MTGSRGSAPVNRPCFRRLLLKVSGEALLGEEPYGISPAMITHVAEELVEVHAMGMELGIVVGGGNIFRGVSGASQGMDRAVADQMGMLATIMNSLALQDAISRKGVSARVLSAIEVGRMAEPFVRGRAIRHLEKGRVVIFAAGTGNPFFTTDTAATLRALEIKADCLFKATRVDGVYDKDPHRHPDAQRFAEITYGEVLERGLKFMDAAAVSLAREAGLPIIVFSMNAPGNILRAVRGENIGTLVIEGEKI